MWVAPDDEIVHGYDAFDAVGNAMRQFVAETVENVHLIRLEVHGDAMAAPKIGKVAVEARWFPCGNIGIAGKIVAVVAGHVGGIEDGADLVVLVCKATDEHAAIVAQPGVIFECSFSFEANDHIDACLF